MDSNHRCPAGRLIYSQVHYRSANSPGLWSVWLDLNQRSPRPKRGGFTRLSHTQNASRKSTVFDIDAVPRCGCAYPLPGETPLLAGASQSTFWMERATRFELATPCLEGKRSDH